MTYNVFGDGRLNLLYPLSILPLVHSSPCGPHIPVYFTWIRTLADALQIRIGVASIFSWGCTFFSKS